MGLLLHEEGLNRWMSVFHVRADLKSPTPGANAGGGGAGYDTPLSPKWFSTVGFWSSFWSGRAMASQVRIRFIPLRSPVAPQGQFQFDGAGVNMETRGPSGSHLKPGGEMKAKLSFGGRYFSRARGGGEEETTRLATLEGTLFRSGSAPHELLFVGGLDSEGRPVGLVPAETIADDALRADERAADQREHTQIRVLRFLFDPKQFQNVGQAVASLTSYRFE